MSIDEFKYAGMSSEQASREAVKVCEVAAKSGKTIEASRRLNALVRIMEAAR